MGADRGRVAHPYGELIELAKRERDLIVSRDLDGLGQLVEARAGLIDDLPPSAPAEAHDAVMELIELQKQNDAASQQATQGLEVELSRLRTGRAGVRRYAPAVTPAATRLDFSA
ncbi:MAG: hypothetical protein ACJ77M_02645 [Thermoleophilaceae bacterium]